ncbi:MAG: phospholipase D-like domain-containing protein [Oligoflexia bacterium]|nr:phospholipase D-like domain-containing protein [Oligoflexia bacterium]
MLKKDTKFLDLWERPDDAGDAIGCLSTSFTFDSGEYEEECLSRFLQLSADAKEEKIIQVIELETRLQQLGTVTAFVDARNASGKRSPRWTIAPVHAVGSVFHPKVQILVWAKCVRIIIGSANISLSGLRYNTELAVAFDYKDLEPASLDFALDVIKFFKKINKEAMISEKNRENVTSLLEKTELLLRSFELMKPEVPYFFVPAMPKSSSVYEQLLEIKKSHIFDYAFIESPSFDLPGTKNEAAEKIWDLLRKNGEATVTYNLQGREDKKQKSYDIIAPESLVKTFKANQAVKIRMYEAKKSERGDFHGRMLHSKLLVLVGDKKSLVMMGSSNFSTLGLGLSKKKSNFEANVVFLLDSSKTMNQFIDQILLPSEEVDIKHITWLPEKSVDQAELIAKVPFPDFIECITFNSKDEEAFYRVNFSEQAPEFTVLAPDGRSLNSNNKRDKNRLTLMVKHIVPYSDLKIEWEEKSALFPVSIESQDEIPAPDYLKNLSLEDLVSLLSSNLPLQKALQKFLRKKNQEQNSYEEIVNPHDRVDTSKFILQRTRQFGWAISALKRQIENNPNTIEQLRWRLSGPVGVFAIKDAVLRFFPDSEERTFFLAEIIGELYRLKIPATKTLKKEEITKEVNIVIDKLKNELSVLKIQSSILIQNYIKDLEANYVEK